MVKRTAGVLPLVGALAAACALTGVAVASVADAGCSSPSHYVRASHHVELVGGCIGPSDLPSGSVQLGNPGAHPADFLGSRP